MEQTSRPNGSSLINRSVNENRLNGSRPTESRANESRPNESDERDGIGGELWVDQMEVHKISGDEVE